MGEAEEGEECGGLGWTGDEVGGGLSEDVSPPTSLVEEGALIAHNGISQQGKKEGETSDDVLEHILRRDPSLRSCLFAFFLRSLSRVSEIPS